MLRLAHAPLRVGAKADLFRRFSAAEGWLNMDIEHFPVECPQKYAKNLPTSQGEFIYFNIIYPISFFNKNALEIFEIK